MAAMRAAPDHERVDRPGPKEILETFAAEMRANQRHYSIYRRQLRADRDPEAAARAHLQDGELEQDATSPTFIHERARIHRREWADVGKGAVVRDRGDSVYPAMDSPDQLLVVAAAGGPAGGFGAIIPPWLGQQEPRPSRLAIGACVGLRAAQEIAEVMIDVMIRVLDPTQRDEGAGGRPARAAPCLARRQDHRLHLQRQGRHQRLLRAISTACCARSMAWPRCRDAHQVELQRAGRRIHIVAEIRELGRGDLRHREIEEAVHRAVCTTASRQNGSGVPAFSVMTDALQRAPLN